MSNDNLIIDQDFSWDAPLVTDAGSGRKHFAALKMYSPSVIPFQAGQSFTLPGVFDDKYDENTKLTRREGQKVFKAMILGSTAKKHRFYVLVATQQDKAGNEYQVVKGFKSWPEKGRKNVWAELQFPALQKLPADSRVKLGKGEAIYVSFEDTATGDTYTPENGNTYDVKYWDGFTVYPTMEALKEAEREHFAQFGDSSSNGAATLLDDFPITWRDKKGDMAKMLTSQATLLQQLGASGPDLVAKAKEMSLIAANGEVVTRLDGSTPISLAALFAKAKDVPQETLEETFAELYK